MSRPDLIGPPQTSTPAGREGTRSRARELPEDLLRDAARRLGIMSLVAAALWVLGGFAGHLAELLVSGPDSRWSSWFQEDTIAVVAIAISLALYVYTRRSKRSARFILDLGLVYLVVMAFALGLLTHVGSLPAPDQVQPVISWIGAAVLMFAAIVPNAPLKVAVSSFVAVSMNPLAMLTSHSEHHSLAGALLMHYPDYFLVGVAVVISLVVTRLGQQVSRAREMGSYRIGELIGRGGMAEVYQARHRMLARPAAIKLIRPEMLAADDDGLASLVAARFRREAEAAANLRSPHTVQLYDFGITEDDTLYLVMELLDGMDLEKVVRTHGPMPIARAIHILRQVCESLEEAHACGLVHRDIKPANIHVGRIGLRHDFVKVLDFGLVKPVAGDERERVTATAQGMAAGTPAYMPPEMALGESVDARADIYALGCVGYFLVTGKLVFEADNSFQMVLKHLNAEPEPPSRRVDASIPSQLESLIMACLAKSPTDRPQSVADIDRALSRIEVDIWGESEAARWWREHGPEPAHGVLSLRSPEAVR